MTIETKIAEAPVTVAPVAGPAREISKGRSEIPRVLEEHSQWLLSGGEAGSQANLGGAHLEGMDLTDARLCDAVLNKVDLVRADLLLADLRRASLVRANLKEANLLSTKLQETDLQGANLSGAVGLQVGQLAGANLYCAELSKEVGVGQAVAGVTEKAGTARWLVLTASLLAALIGYRTLTVSDLELVRNGPLFGGAFAKSLQLFSFFLVGPVAILGLYLTWHLYLQRLWEAAALLPAVFPDGRSLDKCLPWIFRWPARAHFKFTREQKQPLWPLESILAKALLYWIIPAGLFCFWARYLTMQDVRGSLLQVVVVSGAVCAALHFSAAADKCFRAELHRGESSNSPSIAGWTQPRTLIPIGVAVVLTVISTGTSWGVPHDDGTSDRGPLAIRAWAGDVLWWFGYDPVAHLAELEISTRLDHRGNSEDLSGVRGAQLSGLRLRYVRGYGAFFAKAKLSEANLAKADLAATDLRQANLRRANLQQAVLEGARLNGAILPQANLGGANLVRSDLRGADASHTTFIGASLLETQLDGANLFGADLRATDAQRASLEKADLREANLQRADLSMANLRAAYLSSAKLGGTKLTSAELEQAFLTQADLRGANLAGANLQGAIVTEADFAGANLRAADLRGAVGLTGAQLCSATDFHDVQLDENVQRDVFNRCSIGRVQ